MMLALDQKWRQYQDGTVSIGDYLVFLREANKRNPTRGPSPAGRGTVILGTRNNFPMMSLFLKTWALEKSLDFNKAEQQRNRFLSRLTEKISKSELERLVQASVALRAGALTYPDYYRQIRATAAKTGVALSEAPEFDRYISYVLQADAIQSETLLSDISQCEDDVWARLCKTSEQTELHRLSKKLRLAEKLVRLTLTSQEWNDYKKICYCRQRVDDGRSPFESFYAAADARNTAMFSNFKKALAFSHSNVSVLVAGGFHSEGLGRLLQQGATVITVSPKLTKVDNTNSNDYLNVFIREKTPLEQLFDAPKISLPITSALDPMNNGNPAAPVIRGLTPSIDEVLEKLKFESPASVVGERFGCRVVAVLKNSPNPAGSEEFVLDGFTKDGTHIWVYKLSYGKDHPWGKAGAIVQTAEEIRSVIKHELEFPWPMISAAMLAIAIFNSAKADLWLQIIVGLAAGIADFLSYLPEFRNRHRDTHNDSGWEQILAAHIVYSALSLSTMLGVYYFLHSRSLGMIGIGAALFSALSIYYGLHYVRNRRAARNPRIAPLSDYSLKGLPDRLRSPDPDVRQWAVMKAYETYHAEADAHAINLYYIFKYLFEKIAGVPFLHFSPEDFVGMAEFSLKRFLLTFKGSSNAYLTPFIRSSIELGITSSLTEIYNEASFLRILNLFRKAINDPIGQSAEAMWLGRDEVRSQMNLFDTDGQLSRSIQAIHPKIIPSVDHLDGLSANVETIPDFREAKSFDVVDRNLLQDQIVAAILTELNQRESEILTMRFGLLGRYHTLEEVARAFKVTGPRIRAIQARALQKLSYVLRDLQQNGLPWDLTEENSQPVDYQYLPPVASSFRPGSWEPAAIKPRTRSLTSEEKAAMRQSIAQELPMVRRKILPHVLHRMPVDEIARQDTTNRRQGSGNKKTSSTRPPPLVYY